MGVPKPLEERVILTPDKVKPSCSNMEVVSAGNPGGVIFDKTGETYLLIRVIEEVAEKWEGHIAFPRAIKNPEGLYEVKWDWEREETDAVVNKPHPHSLILLGPERLRRPRYISHFRLMKSRDGIDFKPISSPLFFPWEEYEEFGIEDPRITRMEEPIRIQGEEYYYLVTYVACSSRRDICTALAVTNDFENFVRLPANKPNVIFSAPSKDVVIFPEKIRNPRTGKREYCALTRPMGSGYMSPSIEIAYSRDLVQWGDPESFVKGDEKGHVGAGAPPIKLDEGWLIIYHQHRHQYQTFPKEKDWKEYIGTILLADKKDPRKILRKSDEFMEPHLPIQTGGIIKGEGRSIVDNVVFPGAAILHDDRVYIYAGAADVATTLHIYKLDDLLDCMRVV